MAAWSAKLQCRPSLEHQMVQAVSARMPCLAILPQRIRYVRRCCIVSRCHGHLRGCAGICKGGRRRPRPTMNELYLGEMRETSFHPCILGGLTTIFQPEQFN